MQCNRSEEVLYEQKFIDNCRITLNQFSLVYIDLG